MNIKRFNQFINEDKIKAETLYPKLVDIAKKYDYSTFLTKSDGVDYNILYRGMAEDDELTNNIFMTDYIGHARDYSDNDDSVDGLIYDIKDVLYFNDNVFNNLRTQFKNINKKELTNIYSDAFKNNKLFDVMEGEYETEKDIINFVLNFLKSDIQYTKVQNDKVKNDLLIPIMTYYAKTKNKNIISFVGGDYSDYGGADEFVVNDISKYKKLSEIWKESNNKK